jgi:hypothetical protein
MKFNSLSELLEFVNNSEFDTSEYDFYINKKENNQCAENVRKISNFKRVELDFPSGKKEYNATLGDKNVLYVESFESIPNLCGSGSFIFDGRKINCNICEFENNTKVSLDVTVDGVSQNKEFYLAYIHERIDENLITLKNEN